MAAEAQAGADAELREGDAVGRYRVERVLGAGSAGTVYAAVDGAGRRVAVKVLRRALAEDARAVARFEREARALRAVRHPHIVEAQEVGRLPDGRPFLVMPWMEGRSLREELAARERPFSLAEAWAVARAVAEALDAAHALGIVHRDLKPENVFLARENDAVVPRLLDFGVAKVPAPGERALTETGVVVGTPAYIAPEQWWNKGVGPATDQYALGATLFEMVSGRQAFPAESFAAAMQAHLSAPPPTFASAGVAASPAAEAWLARTLAREPAARFASMRALVEAGDAAFGVPRASARTPRAWAMLAALLAPLALLCAGYAGRHDPRSWARLAGWGFWPVLGAYLAGLALLAPRRAGLLRWLALAPGLLGTIGTYAGWLAVLRYVARLPVTEQFEVFNLGMYEADVNRFVGFVLSGGLCLAVQALGLPSAAATGQVRREAWIAAAGFGALAAVAVGAGAPSGALVAGAAAVGHALALAPPRARAEELARGFSRLLAVVLVAAGALTRVDAREAVLWSAQPGRAARAAEVVAAAGERTTTASLALVAVAATLGFAAMRVARAPRGAGLPAGAGRAAALGVFLLAWTTLDGALHGRVAAQRATLWNALAPQFAMFARLDPPTAAGLPAPHAAPALQLARDVVAVDASPVVPLAALDAIEGTGALAGDLGRRLARARDGLEGPVQLLVTVDRGVAWGRVARALGVAYALGVRRVEVLLTRGPAPRLSAQAPLEAAYALPRDFGAVRVELAVGEGEAFEAEEDAVFATVAPRLVEAARAGAVRVRVERGKRAGRE
jgi:serine/threonine-protein kinase